MTRRQWFRYEMFVRVRDFGVANVVAFPEGSSGGQAFARVAAALTAIDEHQADHLRVQAEARRVKAATRDRVFACMKTIAAAARRLTRKEPAESPFVLPRKRRLGAELAAANAFLEAAVPRRLEFERYGLPPTFMDDFRTSVQHLQQAVDVRLTSRTVRRRAQSGMAEAMAEGMDAARDLDVIVAATTRTSDPVTFAAWGAARRIEGLASRRAKQPVPALSAADAPSSKPAAPAVSEFPRAS